jgi:hypothetical protein
MSATINVNQEGNMWDVIITSLIDFAIYSWFVLLYAVVGGYQNTNVFGMKWDWKVWVNGIIKWAGLGFVVVGTATGASILISQATVQGIELTNVQAIAPRVIFGIMLLASGYMVAKIIAKLSTKVGLTDEQLKKIQETSVNTDADKPLILNLDNLPMPSDDYIAFKLKQEAEGGIGANFGVNMDSYDSFRAGVIGRGFNVDGRYGWQCWDLPAVLYSQLGLSLVTGNGLAIGCWDLKRDVNSYGGKFALVTNVNDLKRGDIVVMRPNHIGFFDGWDGDYMLILGQNQGGNAQTFVQDGYTTYATNVVRIAKSAFAGAFRYSGWVSSTPAPTPTPPQASGDTSGFKVGDTVRVSNPVDTKGTHLAVSGEYTVMEISNGSVVIGRGGVVTARILASNLVKVSASSPAPAPASFSVGDTVVPTSLVDYDGRALTQYDKNYTISELKGDRAVLVARGVVWSAMNTKDIKKA